MCVPCWAVPRYDTHHGNGAANGNLTLRTLLKYGGRHNGVILHLRTAYGFPCFFVIHRRVAKVFAVQRKKGKKEKKDDRYLYVRKSSGLLWRCVATPRLSACWKGRATTKSYDYTIPLSDHRIDPAFFNLWYRFLSTLFVRSIFHATITELQDDGRSALFLSLYLKSLYLSLFQLPDQSSIIYILDWQLSYCGFCH